MYMCMYCGNYVGTAHSGHSVMGPNLIPTFHRPVVMLVASDIVPVTSCGPLVHSSAGTLCVTLMASSSPLDMGHPLLSPHMHVHP